MLFLRCVRGPRVFKGCVRHIRKDGRKVTPQTGSEASPRPRASLLRGMNDPREQSFQPEYQRAFEESTSGYNLGLVG